MTTYEHIEELRAELAASIDAGERHADRGRAGARGRAAPAARGRIRRADQR